MKISNPNINILISLIILIFIVIGTCYTRDLVQPFSGNILNYQYMLGLILIYLIVNTLNAKTNNQSLLLKINSILLICEIVLFIPLLNFNLTYYPFIISLVLLKVIQSLAVIYAYFKNQNVMMIRANYDLLILGLLYGVISYSPQVFEMQVSISLIKNFINMMLFICILINLYSLKILVSDQNTII